MLHSILVAVLLVVTLSQVSNALPVSSNHRFAVYTPYWSQGPHSQTPREFIQERFNCGDLCQVKPNLLPPQSGDDFTNSIPLMKTDKRNKNLYKTGWTMGGMPFSVLYMNPKPKISVRSPTAESLRSLPPTYGNREHFVKEPIPASESRFDDYVQAQALSSGLDGPMPTLMPTRRQYSIIPQLFVSYGWGPLGK